MIRSLIAAAAITAGFTITIMPAKAMKDSDKCHFAWEDRNSVYKEKNYCFKTAKAKAWFGENPSNCKATVVLDANDWARINAAKKLEKKYC